MSEPTDYEKIYDERWREIVENPDGTLNADQVKRELADYSDLMGRVTEVYQAVTGGMTGKPTVLASEIIGLANQRMDEACDDAINDLIKSLEMDPDESFASVAGVVALIRNLTGVKPD